MTGKLKTILMALGGILIALSLVLVQYIPHRETMMVSEPPESVYSNTVAAAGIIEAMSENIDLGIFIPGVVKNIYVGVNDTVKKGQPLILIDDEQLKAEITLNETIVAEKKLTLAKLGSQFRRVQSIEDRRAVSVEEYDNRHLDYHIALVLLREAQAQLQAKKIDLKKHTIIAPKDGQVLRLNVRVGEYLSNDLQSPHSPPITIGSPSMQVRVDVDEENAARIHPGFPAIGYTKGLNKIPLELEFVRIEPYVVPKLSLTGAGDERTDTRVLQVIYAVKGTGTDPIYVGQQVDVYIEAVPLPQQ
jgi:HlyD family secretion protein